MKTTSEKEQIKKLIFNLIILGMLFIFVLIVFPEGIKPSKNTDNSIAHALRVAKLK